MKKNFNSFFTPKDKIFTPLFREGSQYLFQAGELLEETIKTEEDQKRLELIDKIYEIESLNDDVTHRIKKALSKTFITPFDREDIHQLASLVDDIIDLINVVAKKIRIYGVKPNEDKSIIRLAELIREACHEIHLILQDISKIRKDIHAVTINVHTIENLADDIHDNALQELFDLEKDVKEIIKLKEIYKDMEYTTDKCEDVIHIMESIHIKYS